MIKKLINKKSIIVASSVFLVLTCIITVILVNFKETKKHEEEIVEENITNSSSFRYKTLLKESLELSDDEKLVLDYFDNSYTRLTSNIALATQKYTSLFKNVKMYVEGEVLDVIQSDDLTYKAIIKIYDDNYDHLVEENDYCIIEGFQQLERFQKGDYIAAYGLFETSELIEYEGINYTMPKIRTEKWNENGAKFSNDDVRKISKYIFGENIRFDNPKGCAYNRYCENYPVMGYLVKLENPKNPNYTMFNVFRGGGFIEVGYCTYENYDDLCYNTQQNIEVSYDYKHFIILTYETSTETAYMEYYDRDFNKIWRKEIDKEGSIDYSGVRGYYDYNENYLTFVMDGYLSIISLTDGSDVIEPALIGTDHEIVMFSDYILLFGYDKKDYIIKLNYNGEIEEKISIKDSEIDSIHKNSIQLVDNKITIVIEGFDKYGYSVSKVIKLDENSNIETQSGDF